MLKTLNRSFILERKSFLLGFPLSHLHNFLEYLHELEVGKNGGNSITGSLVTLISHISKFDIYLKPNYQPLYDKWAWLLQILTGSIT